MKNHLWYLSLAASFLLVMVLIAACGGSGGGGGDGHDPVCIDGDTDGFFAQAGCGTEVDCNDADPDNWTAEGCLNCTDGDADGWYAGCDGYSTIAGPDCDDGDSSVYPGALELCDGIGNQCPGDPFYGSTDMGCMTFIPAGCFYMGDSSDDCSYDPWECPVHTVCIITDFYMDVHETTNAEYKSCVDAGVCTLPSDLTSETRQPYYGNPAYANFPVIWVSWQQATDYCAWAGKRLPTEAEWEYAARGGLSGSRYPWGDTISGTDANYGSFDNPWNYDTSPVEYYAPNGYGLYDMAGNAWEWVNDYLSESSYYQYCVDNIIIFDPPGPGPYFAHAMRGGSCAMLEQHLRVANRDLSAPSMLIPNIGFRCVKN